MGTGVELRKGTNIAVLTVGAIADNVSDALDGISEDIGHYDMRFVKPLDEALLHTVFQQYKTIITVEDGVIAGGFGSAVSQFASENNYANTLQMLGIPDAFPEHGKVDELRDLAGISSEKIAEVLQKYLS